MLSALVFGLLIGLSLGMVGGGGAVLAVPVLVYAVGLGVHEATTVSLAVVAAGAATGAVGQARRSAVCWTSAAWFAVAASLGGIIGTIANRALGGAALLLLFSGVMLLAARATWQRASSPIGYDGSGCPHASVAVLLPVGLGVGALTGLVGVGGGFVVVPTLAVGLHFGMREAIGTSIVIVAIVSLMRHWPPIWRPAPASTYPSPWRWAAPPSPAPRGPPRRPTSLHPGARSRLRGARRRSMALGVVGATLAGVSV